MKNLIYTPDVSSVAMPMTMVVADWIIFFKKLMKLDAYAPLISVLYYFEIIEGLDLDVPISPFKPLYYDTGIEMAADDRFPALEAAVEAGFYAKGIDMMTDAARDKICAADKGVAEFIQNRRTASKGNSLTCCDPEDWKDYIEGMLRTDPCAAASILNYYLHYAAGQTLHFFCPLGCDLYDHIGKKMAEDSYVLKVAVDIGLMASAIATHFGAALDVVENWNYLLEGTKFLLESEALKCFIPFSNCVVAEALMAEFGEVDYDGPDVDRWYDRNRELHEFLRNGEYRGY